MLCPRCQLKLELTDYEGQSVSFCSTCWGHWMTLDQLDRIIADRGNKFSGIERKTIRNVVNQHGDKDRSGIEQANVLRPVCSAKMGKRTYEEGCPIVLDACPAHGVWLDGGELKELQVLHE